MAPPDLTFVRAEDDLVVSVTLLGGTDLTQGLLDANRLWAAVLHERKLVPAPAPDTASADTRRAS